MERQETKIHAALQYADERVPDQGFLVGGALSLADLALAGALEYVDFRYGSHWRERHARLAAWLAPMSARPSMLHTQPPR
jgi:glutathione S-transferase